MKCIPFLFLSLFLSLISLSGFSQTYPGKTWEYHPAPAFNGWDLTRLATLQQYVVDSTVISGMMVIHDGKVILEYGDVEQNSYIASCRKSVLAMLYGKHVKNGTIDLKAKIKDLKVVEKDRLWDSEQEATVQDIISARSGVFLTGSNTGDLRNLAPPRGSVAAGEFWLYSNWDFNMAGHIFEVETGKNIYDELESQFATPLQMQDWKRSLQTKSGDPLISEIMAYHMWFSTRDMARLGLLMLNEGKWKDQQLIDPAWVKEMTTPHTSFQEVDSIAPFFSEMGGKFGYGYMWWLRDDPEVPALKGSYSAQGAWGQDLTIIPELNTVVCIRTNSAFRRQKGGPPSINYIIKELTECFHSDWQKELQPLEKTLTAEDFTEFGSLLSQMEVTKLSINLESELNQLGYRYLGEEKIEQAVAIFEINLQLFPNSWNLYDSMGEGYFMAGAFEKSKANYQKAITLNPDNLSENNDRVKVILENMETK